MPEVKIIECPRDAMQGIHEFIPTSVKINYIRSLLKVGFDTIDVGSFVSEKSIPQMKDTAVVLNDISGDIGSSKLLVIIGNVKGAEMAAEYDEISYLGFPFSISETFQQRNTNASMEEALIRVERIKNICDKSGKELVIYISMAFGNPYGEKWDVDIAARWVDVMVQKEIKIISLADTIGTSTADGIKYLAGNLLKKYPGVEFGAHIHTKPLEWFDKVDAAFKSGIRRFDGAIRGFGGCPMASDNLVGNMPTEALLSYFDSAGLETGINKEKFQLSIDLALKTFPV